MYHHPRFYYPLLNFLATNIEDLFFLLGGYPNHFAVFCLCNLNFNFKFKAPLLARKAKLQDAERLKRFLHDVEDEEAWIREKEPIASSTNTGRDLTGAQNLSKKHQALMVSAGKKIMNSE